MVGINPSRLLDCTDNTTIATAAYGAALGLFIYLLGHDLDLSPLINDQLGWIFVGIFSLLVSLSLIVVMRYYQ